jgi:hypothetical protein
MVTEVRKVQVPRTVAKWVPYTTVRYTPRTVMMRAPADVTYDYSASYAPPADSIISSGTTFSYPDQSLQKPPTPADTEEPASGEEGDEPEQAGAEAADAAGEEAGAQDGQADDEPSDDDPTGMPEL